MPEKALSFSASLESIKGFGPKKAAVFSKIGINCAEELIHFYPKKYLERSIISSISKLKIGSQATVVGRVVSAGLRRGKKKQYFQALLSDQKSSMVLTWFQGAAYLKNIIKVGDKLAVSGKIEFFKSFQIVHPEYNKLKEDEDPFSSDSIIPLYSISSELKKNRIDNRVIRKMMKSLFDSIDHFPDHFHLSLCKEYNIIDLKVALKNIHFPESKEMLDKSVYRLKFDEHYFLQMLLALRKSSIKQVAKKPLNKIGPQLKLISDSLPFDLTNAQKKVISDIKNGLDKPYAMNRLIQGDVGSGKTIVSILAAALAVANKVQVSLMAPTAILAYQHYESFKKYSDIAHITCAVLVGSTPKKDRDKIIKSLKDGQIDIIIGTHALIQKDVKFKELGLVIVDEQHKFGVIQRADLTSKGLTPHFLAMTATPIPRTLAITYHGDMDVSIIDEMPKNRIPIVTKVVDSNRLGKVYDFMKKEVKACRQCMVVYPLVQETEKSDLAAAVEMHSDLSINIFPDYRVGLIHGKMKKTEKDLIMNSFSQNEIEILISTTVIEVGIDIPNATVMLIEHADRFGLTQLHQLRGRVGRGTEKSYCILVQRNFNDKSKKRLTIMESTNDGFEISDEDLKLRGPGEFFGIRQSGFFKFKIADMVLDGPILRLARKAAFRLIKKDPNLSEDRHSFIRKRFIRDYQGRLEHVNIS